MQELVAYQSPELQSPRPTRIKLKRAIDENTERFYHYPGQKNAYIDNQQPFDYGR
jgi:hypothetical protein